jgi:hypothetical protein
MNKISVSIDINEILRARWLQFDKYYLQEFGEEGLPENQQHIYDFFNNYPWKDKTEILKELKEPEDMPDNINPIHYQVDDKTGEANADIFLFKKTEEKKLSAKEIYNRFMYEDFVFEIFGTAPLMYKGLDLHMKNFYLKYQNDADIALISVENIFSIPSTLFFLSKSTSIFKNYYFVDNALDMWKNTDVLITTDPEILKSKIPWNKKLIKVRRPYNEDIKVGSLEITHFIDLINNPDFEKIIKYKK